MAKRKENPGNKSPEAIPSGPKDIRGALEEAIKINKTKENPDYAGENPKSDSEIKKDLERMGKIRSSPGERGKPQDKQFSPQEIKKFEKERKQFTDAAEEAGEAWRGLDLRTGKPYWVFKDETIEDAREEMIKNLKERGREEKKRKGLPAKISGKERGAPEKPEEEKPRDVRKEMEGRIESLKTLLRENRMDAFILNEAGKDTSKLERARQRITDELQKLGATKIELDRVQEEAEGNFTNFRELSRLQKIAVEAEKTRLEKYNPKTGENDEAALAQTKEAEQKLFALLRRLRPADVSDGKIREEIEQVIGEGTEDIRRALHRRRAEVVVEKKEKEEPLAKERGSLEHELFNAYLQVGGIRNVNKSHPEFYKQINDLTRALRKEGVTEEEVADIRNQALESALYRAYLKVQDIEDEGRYREEDRELINSLVNSLKKLKFSDDSIEAIKNRAKTEKPSVKETALSLKEFDDSKGELYMAEKSYQLELREAREERRKVSPEFARKIHEFENLIYKHFLAIGKSAKNAAAETRIILRAESDKVGKELEAERETIVRKKLPPEIIGIAFQLRAVAQKEIRKDAGGIRTHNKQISELKAQLEKLGVDKRQIEALADKSTSNEIVSDIYNLLRFQTEEKKPVEVPLEEEKSASREAPKEAEVEPPRKIEKLEQALEGIKGELMTRQNIEMEELESDLAKMREFLTQKWLVELDIPELSDLAPDTKDKLLRDKVTKNLELLREEILSGFERKGGKK